MKILLVEDSAVNAKFLQNSLKQQVPDADISVAVSLESTRLQLEAKTFDVVLLDLNLPDSEGIGTVSRVVKLVPKTAIVVLTGVDDEKVGWEAIHSGAQDYLVKSQYDSHLLIRIINYAIERKSLTNQLETAMANIKTLKGLLPICFRCKKIRNDKGFWDSLEIYIKAHSDADFSHGLCPACYDREISDLKKTK